MRLHRACNTSPRENLYPLHSVQWQSTGSCLEIGCIKKTKIGSCGVYISTEAAFSSTYEPRVMESTLVSGSLLWGKSASPSPAPSPIVISLSVGRIHACRYFGKKQKQINKQKTVYKYWLGPEHGLFNLDLGPYRMKPGTEQLPPSWNARLSLWAPLFILLFFVLLYLLTNL